MILLIKFIESKTNYIIYIKGYVCLFGVQCNHDG